MGDQGDDSYLGNRHWMWLGEWGPGSIYAAFSKTMVYSICGFLAVLIPRSGTLVDLVSNSFFGSCLFNFGRLMMSYMGGVERMWEIVGPNRRMAMNATPCCCCICLKPRILTRKLFARISVQVIQVALVRPIIMFLASVLWTNESYQAGNMSFSNGFLYVTVVNMASTVIGIYGLMLMRGALMPELEKDFLITGKILSIQLAMVTCSALPNFIIGLLVSSDVIGCSPVFPSKARGEVLYHGLLVLMMLPCALLGRKFYRRSSDGCNFAGGLPPPSEIAVTTQPLNSQAGVKFPAADDDDGQGYMAKAAPTSDFA